MDELFVSQSTLLVDPAPPELCPDLALRLEGNLKALHPLQPDLAEALSRAAGAPGQQVHLSRDGCWTFRLSSPTGAGTWMGGTSMPRLSAQALFGERGEREGSAVLPGILSGWEAVVSLRELAPGCALFVCEDDVSRLRLALELHDFREELAARRLIFISEVDARVGLSTFFAAHPGFEFPRRLLRTPQVSAERFLLLQRQVEEAAGQVQQAQRRRVLELRDALTFETPEDAAPPRLLVFSAETSLFADRWMEDIRRAIGVLGWRGTVLKPSDPASRHVCAVLAAAQSLRVNLILILEGAGEALSEWVPAHIRIASWYSPGVSPDSAAVRSRSVDTLAFASTTRQLSALQAARRPSARTELLEPAIEINEAAPARGSEPRRGLAVMIRAEDDRPQRVGIRLSSHETLYQAMQAVCMERVRGAREAAPSDVFLEASRRTGLALQDDELRQQFERLVGERLIPAAWTRAAWDCLVEAGFHPEAEGNLAFPLSSEAADAPVPTARHSGNGVAGARVQVWPVCGEADAAELVLAIAQGRVVVARRYARDLRAAHPMLHSALEDVHWFDTLREAVQLAREATSDASPVCKAARSAGPVLDGHTMAARLLHLLARVRAEAP